jgi:uroporphyrinogen III methyltransferase/synthase
MIRKEAESSLRGRRIVVTRAREQAAGLTASLRLRGAEVIEAPAIRIEPPSDWTPLDEAIDQLERFDWIIFTSTNGVKSFMERMHELDRQPSVLVRAKAKLAAIGPATKAELESNGLRADVVPKRFIAEEVFEAINRFGRLEGSRILLPRADIARQTLPDLLRSEGAHVDVVVAYRTVAAREDIRRAVELVLAGEVDVVTFTSGSTVSSFFSVIESTERLRGRFVPASIGPITSQALRDRGFAPGIEAAEYTSEGLVKAIVDYYAEKPKRNNAKARRREGAKKKSI